MTDKARDLGAVFDEHMRCEFVLRDVEATMRTMTASPYLTHVPTLTGGVGWEGVRNYYREHFVGHWPADTKLIPISRTVGTDQLVDEFVIDDALRRFGHSELNLFSWRRSGRRDR